ncbi:MAG: membrane protein insertion efficiency factor YidD [Bacteroidota bacterium]|jgi:putative component of membrane protein insertase Oxa1/YidC/SpoIIIJ protein YidD
MKFILIIALELYKWIIPLSIKRKCIFREPCSSYVLRKTKERGFLGGIRAITIRLHQCRTPYSLTLSALDNKLILLAADGSVIPEDEISVNLVDKFSESISAG